MKKQEKREWIVAGALLAAFVLWTVLIRFVDVQAIGPDGSAVGFATLNAFVHRRTGVHMSLYTVTDWLGLVPIAFMLSFAALGAWQWICRKRLGCVDRSILVLGAFYAAVLAVYVLFELLVINFRPVLIDGRLEASYPSSTTVLVLCVMPTSAMYLHRHIKGKRLRCVAVAACVLFAAFMVGARLLSGVHWLTDIVGGILISAGLVRLYAAFVQAE